MLFQRLNFKGILWCLAVCRWQDSNFLLVSVWTCMCVGVSMFEDMLVSVYNKKWWKTSIFTSDILFLYWTQLKK